MLKREDWTEYPREIPVAPGWYIVWVKLNSGDGYLTVAYFNSGDEFEGLFSDRRVTHWSDFQTPTAESTVE